MACRVGRVSVKKWSQTSARASTRFSPAPGQEDGRGEGKGELGLVPAEARDSPTSEVKSYVMDNWQPGLLGPGGQSCGAVGSGSLA